MARLLGAAIVIFWLVMMGLLVREEILPGMLLDEDASYADPLRRRLEPEESLMGIYLGAQRIGASYTAILPHSDASFEIQNATTLNHPLLTRQALMEIHSRTSVNSTYALREFQMDIKSPLTESTQIKGVVRDGSLEVTVQTGAQPPGPPRSFPLGGNETLSNGISPFLSMPNLSVGKTWKIHYFNPFAGGGRQTMIARVESREPIEWEGREQDAFVVVVDNGRDSYRAWILPDGKVIREEIPFGSKLVISLQREKVSAKEKPLRPLDPDSEPVEEGPK